MPGLPDIPDGWWWLSYGERGLSSETMFYWLSYRAPHYMAVPLDTHDLRRCRLMLQACPNLIPLVPQMAELSRAWEVIVSRWGELCHTMDRELPDWNKTPGWGPKTYQMLNQLLLGALRTP